MLQNIDLSGLTSAISRLDETSESLRRTQSDITQQADAGETLVRGIVAGLEDSLRQMTDEKARRDTTALIDSLGDLRAKLSRLGDIDLLRSSATIQDLGDQLRAERRRLGDIIE